MSKIHISIAHEVKKYAGAPKGIWQHPAVEEVAYGPDSGYDEEYKYDVLLREGWVFESGKNEGCRSCTFRTIQEFKDANPIRKEEAA